MTGREPGATEEGTFLASLPHIGPREQLDIYRQAWFARLRGCLEQDFPGIRYALGEERFSALARDYLEARPPQSWNIARASERFAGYLAGREDLEHRTFIAELALLEWVVTSLFDREAPSPLTTEDFQRMDPERLARARFRKAETAEVLAFTHPVNDYFQAVRDGGHPDVPTPELTAVAVFRAGDRVWRLPLTPPMHSLLRAILDGSTIPEAVERCGTETGIDPALLAGSVGGWFHEFAGGVFGAMEYPKDGLGTPPARRVSGNFHPLLNR